MARSRGVIYLLSNLPSAELLVVSLWSLRQVYGGPVTVFSTHDCEPVTQALRDDARLNVQIAVPCIPDLSGCRRPDWIIKALAYVESPYDYTVYFDADTIVLRDPDDIGRSSEWRGCAVAKCDEVRLMDKHNFARSIRKQMRWFRWNPATNRLVQQAFEANPFVCNNGMLAFESGCPLIRDVRNLTYGLRKRKMHDEIAIHLALPRHPDVQRISGRWNAMCRYQNDDDFQNAHMIHFHHKTFSWVARARPIWRHWFRDVISNDVAGIAGWGGKFNGRVDRMRHSRKMGAQYARQCVDSCAHS